MDYCGYCIHYRCEETPLGHLNEWCAADNGVCCCYHQAACSEYVPDQDYIDFLDGRDA